MSDQEGKVSVQKVAKVSAFKQRYLALLTQWNTILRQRYKPGSETHSLGSRTFPSHLSARLFPCNEHSRKASCMSIVFLLQFGSFNTIERARHGCSEPPLPPRVCLFSVTTEHLIYSASKLYFINPRGRWNVRCIVLTYLSPRQGKLPIKLAPHKFLRCWKAKATLQNLLNMTT